jgi:hypothetical protein
MTTTVRKPGEPTYFDSVSCYQPIKGGTWPSSRRSPGTARSSGSCAK